MKEYNYSTIVTEFNQVNQEIDRNHEETINTDVLHLARSLASKNFPRPDEQDLNPFVSSITAKYATLKNKAAIKLKGSLQKYLGSIGIGRLTQKIEEVKTKLAEMRNKFNNLMLDRDRIEMVNKTVSLKQVWLILAIFGLAEVVYNVSTFITIGDIVIFALILGVIIGFAQILTAKSVTLYIRDIQDTERRKKYIRIAVAGFATFSVMLGILRYYLLTAHQQTPIPFWALNPFCFAIINMVLIVGAALVVYRYFPTREQEAQLEQLRKINKEIKSTSNVITQLETEHDNLTKQKAQALQFHGQIIFDEQKMYEKIDNYYQQAVGAFRNENVIKRTDNEYPGCFRKLLLPPPSPQTEHFTLAKQ